MLTCHGGVASRGRNLFPISETTNHYTIVPLYATRSKHSQVSRARAHTVPQGVPPTLTGGSCA